MNKNSFIILFIFLSEIGYAQIAPTDYSNPQNWAAGKMKVISPINYSPDFTIVAPDTNNQTLVTVEPDTSSSYDIFFVYPTILTSSDSVAQTYPINLVNEAGANIEINWEATAFEQFGRLYAPYYRQGNLATFYPTTSFAAQAAILDTAVTDIIAAFKYYMQNYNKGKRVILVGHSQGAMVLGMLLRKLESTSDSSLLKSVFLSVLMGMESGPYVTKTGLTGGWWQYIPICQNPTDTACVMSWGTHQYGSTVLSFSTLIPFDTILVKQGYMYKNFDSTNLRVFMDPLGFTSAQKTIQFSSYPKTLFESITGTNYSVATDFIGYTNMYYGNITNPNALTYAFTVERIPGIPGDNRIDPLAFSSISDYHVYDAYVGIGDVICLIYEKMGKTCPYNFISTGIKGQENADNGISVFPNPTDDNLNIILPNEKINSVTVYDMLGKEVIATGRTTSINVSALASGMYFISVSGENRTWRQTFVKE